MRYVTYVAFILVAIFVLPGVALSLGVFGNIWYETIKIIAPWSLYILFVAIGFFFLAAFHIMISGRSSKALLQPLYPLVIGFLMIPLSYGVTVYFDDAGNVTTPQSSMPLMPNFDNISIIINAVSNIILKHGTGIAFLYSAVMSVIVIYHAKSK